MAGPDDAEVRDWIVILQAFTPSDLAESMAVSRKQAMKLLRHWINREVVEATGDMVNGSGPAERIYALAPMPPGPRVHPHKTPPEILVYQQMGGDPLRVPRGLPIRLIDHQDRRKKMQVAGGAARKMKDRDRAYEAMLAAVERRKEKNRQRQLDKKEARIEKKRERARIRRQRELAAAE